MTANGATHRGALSPWVASVAVQVARSASHAGHIGSVSASIAPATTSDRHRPRNDSQLDNAAFDPDPDTWYTLKLDYAAGRIRGKVWETGDSEPDWMVDVTDTTWRHGAFGFRANRTAAFDDLYIDGFQTFYQPVAVD